MIFQQEQKCSETCEIPMLVLVKIERPIQLRVVHGAETAVSVETDDSQFRGRSSPHHSSICARCSDSPNRKSLPLSIFPERRHPLKRRWRISIKFIDVLIDKKVASEKRLRVQLGHSWINEMFLPDRQLLDFSGLRRPRSRGISRHCGRRHSESPISYHVLL